MIRKSYAALRNLVTSLPNPNPNISGQVESESESEKNGSDPHHCPWVGRMVQGKQRQGTGGRMGCEEGNAAIRGTTGVF